MKMSGQHQVMTHQAFTFKSTQSWQQGWIKWKDFGGVTKRRDFWYFVQMQLLGSLGIVLTILTALIVFTVVVPIQEAATRLYALLHFAYYGVILACLVWIIPLLAAITRRLRDAGFNPFWVLIWGIPIYGWIALVILAAKPSKGDAASPSEDTCQESGTSQHSNEEASSFSTSSCPPKMGS